MTTPTPPEAAAQFYTSGQAITAAVILALRDAWGAFDPRDIDRSFAAVQPRLVPILASGQVAAARTAQTYVPRVVAETGLGAPGRAASRPAAFIGASSGVSLEELLATVPQRAKELAADISAGRVQSAVATLTRRPTARNQYIADQMLTMLEGIAQTQVADAARAATSVEMAVRPQITGWVRMLNPPACARCVVLAGKFFKWNDGFPRHPRCFPAGVVVSGPGHEAATRRWYDGELVVLTTASGQKLSLTGNHPVLTRRGWVPANLLKEGDDVVRSAAPQGARGLVVPDHHEMPARIEDVWSALRVGGLRRVPSAPQDFHGDGQYGQVDVVGADRALRNGRVGQALREHVVELELASRFGVAKRLDIQGAAAFGDLGDAATSHGAVRLGGLGASLFGRHLSGAHQAGLAGSTAGHASGREAFGDRPAAHAVLPRDRQFTRTSRVGADDRAHRQVVGLSRWDAPGDSFTVKTAEGYAGLGLDLLNRLASQVELDRVVDLRRLEWSGHVYSLTSVEGWHVANSLIVSNCDCRHIPATEAMADDFRVDPKLYFESLNESEQNRIFTKAGAEAVRDGADLNRVVNARLGITTYQVGSERYKVTTVGTGRKGRRRPLRLLPETIYKQANGDRDEAIRLLRVNGYIT